MLDLFLNGAGPTELDTLSLHDALPICAARHVRDKAAALLMKADEHPPFLRDVTRGEPRAMAIAPRRPPYRREHLLGTDRKSTRLNSSHGYISYAVFCLKKKSIDHYADS